MIHAPAAENQTILFGVTSSQSLKLLGRVPSAMAKIGWDVHVAAGDALSEAPTNLSGIKLHIIPMVRNPSPLRDISSLLGWIRFVRQLKPTIVVVGTPKAALLGMLASLVCRVPVRVYHLRGLRLQTVAGPARRLLHLFEWVTARSSTAILAVSSSLKQEYCRLGLSTVERIEVLGFGSSHGVDTEHFHPARWSTWQPPEPELRQSLRSQTPIIGFVGRLSKDKGSEELLACINALQKSQLDHTLLLIGPFEGNEGSFDKLESFGRGTVITGPLENVAPYYAIMDLLLLPTHREGFPNVVLEAAASGVPTVTTNATGAIDSVIDGETGLVFPVFDVDAFVAAVKRLITNPQLSRDLGENARAMVKSRYETEYVTQLYATYLTRTNSCQTTRN